MEPAATERHGARLELTDVSHPESGVVVATAVDTVAGITHRQPFVAFEVDDERPAYLANRVGLRVDGYVDEAPSWVRLVLTTSPAEHHG